MDSKSRKKLLTWVLIAAGAAAGWFGWGRLGGDGEAVAVPADDGTDIVSLLRESTSSSPQDVKTDIKEKEKEVYAIDLPKGLEMPYMLEQDRSKNTVIEHMGYTLSYNSSNRIPNWVAYELLDSELYGDFERRDKFTPDPDIKGRQAYDSDYTGSGWTRGHMANSGDMKWSSQVQKECFYLTNVCPQSEGLNRGAWNDLEKQVRTEAKYYKKVWIVCGPVVGTGRYGTIGSNKVVVPDGFFKALLARRKDGTYASIAFYFPNESCQRRLSNYALTVNDLEDALGMDLFYTLDDKVQEQVESTYDLWNDWRIKDREDSRTQGRSGNRKNR